MHKTVESGDLSDHARLPAGGNAQMQYVTALERRIKALEKDVALLLRAHRDELGYSG